MIKPKKSLGQNFFVNYNLTRQIVDIVEKDNPEVIVEIGPGHGAFSRLFSKQVRSLILVEKDEILAQNLTYEIKGSVVINKDFLEWDLKELAQYRKDTILFFGSLPYNVSKRIIKKIVESEYFTNSAYFIIQKEVAEKYTGREPNNNLLSLRTKIYADVRKLFDIKPESFNPRPKVTSAFTQFSPTESDIVSFDITEFNEFIENAFKQPRKKLTNNLTKYSFRVSERVENFLDKRPQHLSLDDYIFLFTNIS